MKKYIWLNPVTTTALTKANIDYRNLLNSCGYIYVDIDTSLINEVKDKYIDYCEDNTRTIIDARCPKAIEIIKKEYPCLCQNVAPIEPIFITCANYLLNKWVLHDDDAILFMIAPCSSLCNHGNALFKNDVVFLTWKDFCLKNNLHINIETDITPIPLGFFDNTSLNVAKLTGEDNIINSIDTLISSDSKDLVEILYCPNGCHNGDGL